MIIRGTSTTFQDKSKRIVFTITKKSDVLVAAAETVVPSPSSITPSSSSSTSTSTSTSASANELASDENTELDIFKNEMVAIINEKAPNGNIVLNPTLDKNTVETKKKEPLYKTCYKVKDSVTSLTLRIVPTFGDGTCGYYAIQDKTGYEEDMSNKLSRQTILGKLKDRLLSNDDESIKRIKTYDDFGSRLPIDIDNIQKGEFADIVVETNLPTDTINCSLDLCSEVLDTPIEVYKLESDNNLNSDLVLMRKYIPTNSIYPIRRIHYTYDGCHFSILQECDSKNHEQFFVPIQQEGGKRKTHKKQKKPRSRKIRNRRPKKNITSKSI